MANGHVPLEGSERQPLADARKIGPVPSDQMVRVTVTVRRRANLPSPEELAATPLAEQHVLSRAEFAEQYGADPADLDKVEQFAKEHGLEVLEKSPEKRTVVLQGTAPAMSEAFKVELAMYARGDQEYRSREGSVHIPAELEPIVEAVVGLDAHPIARPHFRRAGEGEGRISPHAAAEGFSPVEIAQLYEFPASNPFVIACGGTRLEASNGTVTEEVVWQNIGATGGGISVAFTPPPSYQDSANIDPPANPGQEPGRGVPDVAGDAAPDTGYQVRVDGEDTVIGGTSAVAPLMAGLVARLNQSLRPSIGHPVGFLNAALYAAAHDGF